MKDNYLDILNTTVNNFDNLGMSKNNCLMKIKPKTTTTFLLKDSEYTYFF